MRQILVSAAVVLVGARTSCAQWERVEVAGTGNGPTSRILRSSPHPLLFYLMPTPQRDPTNSLCLGCPLAAGGRQRTLQDFAVETTQRTLGESFARKIIEIVLSFRDRDTPAQMPEEPGFIQWKSIVIESSPDAYRELYLIINNGMFDRKQSKASVYSIEGAQILEVAAYLDVQFAGNVDFCEGSYWVLGTDGPRLIDFTAVDKEVKRLIPSDATLVEPSPCGAITMKELVLRSLVQRIHAECHACDYLGWATVRFRLDGHRAIPVSSSFEPYQEP